MKPYAIVTPTFGVQTPLPNGSCTLHINDEVEALEYAQALNKAYFAGYEDALQKMKESLR
jgi:hypothetical protein